jgi:hypothetical protein
MNVLLRCTVDSIEAVSHVKAVSNLVSRKSFSCALYHPAEAN